MNKSTPGRLCVAGMLLGLLAGGCSSSGGTNTSANSTNPTSSNATEASAAAANVSFASPQPSPGASAPPPSPPSLADEDRAAAAQSMIADPAGSTPAATGLLNEAEQDFVRQALEASANEVDLGRLAEQQGTKPAIKAFGKGMVEDHTAAGGELQALARQFGVGAPEARGDDLARLAPLHGAKFDQAYAQLMVADHEKVLELFRQEATNGMEPTLKKWAQTKVPTLEHHLEMARKL